MEHLQKLDFTFSDEMFKFPSLSNKKSLFLAAYFFNLIKFE